MQIHRGLNSISTTPSPTSCLSLFLSNALSCNLAQAAKYSPRTSMCHCDDVYNQGSCCCPENRSIVEIRCSTASSSSRRSSCLYSVIFSECLVEATVELQEGMERHVDAARFDHGTTALSPYYSSNRLPYLSSPSSSFSPRRHTLAPVRHRPSPGITIVRRQSRQNEILRALLRFSQRRRRR